MRKGYEAVLFLLVWGVPLQAQSAGRWSLSVGADGIRFTGTARDTISPGPSSADLRPSGRVGVRLGAQRRLGHWELGATLGWAQGNVEAFNDAVAIRDRRADLSRYRLAVAIVRELAPVGAGSIAIELAPTLDLWVLDGDARTRAGVEGGLTLRVPLGRLAVEHRLAVGLSGSPLHAAEVGREFELRALRTVQFGVGVRLPL